PGARRLCRVNPQHPHVSCVPWPVALEDLDSGRLAGSVRPQKAEDFAAVDVEVDATHGVLLAVRLAETADADHWLFGARLHSQAPVRRAIYGSGRTARSSAIAQATATVSRTLPRRTPATPRRAAGR